MKLSIYAVCMLAGLALVQPAFAAGPDHEAGVPAAIPPVHASAAELLAQVVNEYRIGPPTCWKSRSSRCPSCRARCG
jgi:hypothetical protein